MSNDSKQKKMHSFFLVVKEIKFVEFRMSDTIDLDTPQAQQCWAWGNVL